MAGSQEDRAHTLVTSDWAINIQQNMVCSGWTAKSSQLLLDIFAEH